MKTTLTALALVLFAGTAHAQNSTLCYGYLSNSPAQVATLIEKDVEVALKELKVPRTQRVRTHKCVRGAVVAGHPIVTQSCLNPEAAEQVEAFISESLIQAFDTCLLESVSPPNRVLPFAEVEPDPESLEKGAAPAERKPFSFSRKP